MRTGRPIAPLDESRFVKIIGSRYIPTPEYRAWSTMLQRCNIPKNPQYANYGGRGIKVCKRWELFDNFIRDIGKKESPELSIDRIDNDGNYEPGNARWATRSEQCRNTRRVNWVGSICATEAAFISGVSHTCIRHRIKIGRNPIAPKNAYVGGENCYLSRLSKEQVLEIRRIYSETKKYKGILKDIGKRFGITNAAVHSIVNRKSWKKI